MKSLLCWIDIETTGLNNMTDEMLEFACIVTDEQLYVKDSIHFLFPKHKVLNPFVHNMHVDSGLWVDIDKAVCDPFDISHYCRSYSEGDEKFVDFLTKLQDQHSEATFYPAGASVHFDMGFLTRLFPYSVSKLNHRYYDVSALKLHLQFMRGEYPSDLAPITPIHRATNDALNSIIYARRLRGKLSAQFVNLDEFSVYSSPTDFSRSSTDILSDPPSDLAGK